ncbi:hypothetical protein ACEPT7_03320 [Burkholderia ubonensis]|uniref:hypothetical protein n=1 Tax=Burkholderia ubonensis TaxID=101571 RepID=UPI00358E0F83
MSIAFPTRPTGRRIACTLLVALAVHLGAALASPGDSLAASAARGARLFDGSAPLRGRIDGHSENLPSTASRCANCHMPSSQRAALAPPLDATTLLAPLRRRGGPPSVYTLDSFCDALRSGVDPAHVTLKSAMPRYDASNEQCADLWASLIPTSEQP